MYNRAKLELYRFRLSEEGRQADTLTIIEKVEEIKQKYIEQARKATSLSVPERGVGKENNDLSDIEGDLEAGVFTESTQEDIEREKALDKEEKSVLDEIDITKPFEYNSLERLAVEGGFTPEQAKIMAAIALAESSGKVRALNDDTETGDLSYGLWQINMIDYPTYKLGEERRKQMKLKLCHKPHPLTHLHHTHLSLSHLHHLHHTHSLACLGLLGYVQCGPVRREH